MPVTYIEQEKKKAWPTFRITASCGCGWRVISTPEEPKDVITESIKHSSRHNHTVDLAGIVRKPESPESYTYYRPKAVRDGSETA